MLVLSRRPGEKILLPDLNVSIHVVAVKPGVVRIGNKDPVFRIDPKPVWLQKLSHLASFLAERS